MFLFKSNLYRRVSTIHTYPSAASIIEQQEIINEPLPAIENQANDEPVQEKSSQVRNDRKEKGVELFYLSVEHVQC